VNAHRELSDAQAKSQEINSLYQRSKDELSELKVQLADAKVL